MNRREEALVSTGVFNSDAYNTVDEFINCSLEKDFIAEIDDYVQRVDYLRKELLKRNLVKEEKSLIDLIRLYFEEEEKK